MICLEIKNSKDKKSLARGHLCLYETHGELK